MNSEEIKQLMKDACTKAIDKGITIAPVSFGISRKADSWVVSSPEEPRVCPIGATLLLYFNTGNYYKGFSNHRKA